MALQKDNESFKKEHFKLLRKNLVLVKTGGESDPVLVDKYILVFNELLNKSQKKIKFLIDFTNVEPPSSVSRKKLKKIINDDKIYKIAIFGPHPVANVVAAFLIGDITEVPIKFFKNREDAFFWLNN